METPATVQTLCENSHKPIVKGWASKVVNRSFLIADDFSGYNQSTLINLCREIDQDIAFINECIKSTKQKRGMYKVILATEAKYQKELNRIKRRRTFLVSVKGWATWALMKEKAEAAFSSSPENPTAEPVNNTVLISGALARQKASQSLENIAQRKSGNWTDKVFVQSKRPSTDAFSARIKEVLKSLVIQKLGSQYYEFCEQAIDTAAAEARDHFERFPDSRNKERWTNAFDSHANSLYSELTKKH
jgi:hypothetical protein